MNNVIEFTDTKAIDRQAAEWLIRLDADDALSAAERARLAEWLGRSAAHRQRLAQLASTWNSMNVLTELAVPLDAPPRSGRLGLAKTLSRSIAVAATILLGIGLGALYVVHDERAAHANGTYTTAIGQQRSVDLPDGSVVRLNTNSQITVDYGEDFRDIALLRGEALFTVAKDSARPFRVTAGYGEIRAVGTAFSVYLRGDSIDVTVAEGIVTLAAAQPLDPSFGANAGDSSGSAEVQPMRDLGTLQAGQTGTISSTTDEDAKRVDVLENIGNVSSAALSRRLAWTDGVLSFSGEPLDEVVKEISRYTTANIEIADAEVGAIRIGGRFPVGQTDTMLETLETNFGLTVSYLPDGRVLISASER